MIGRTRYVEPEISGGKVPRWGSVDEMGQLCVKQMDESQRSVSDDRSSPDTIRQEIR